MRFVEAENQQDDSQRNDSDSDDIVHGRTLANACGLAIGAFTSSLLEQAFAA